jgi:hypothetical protein
MSQIGLNHHVTVANTLKQQARTLYEGALGASVLSPRPNPKSSGLPTVRGLGCPKSTPARRSRPSST